MDTAERCQSGTRAACLGIFINIFLTLLKGIIGILGGSRALVADSFHSGADILASTVVLISLKISGKPADSEHPYGHGKAESIAAKIVALIIILAGINIGFSSLQDFFNGVEKSPAPIALAAAVVSIFVKEGMFRYTFHLGKRISSKALLANAWDHRSDAVSSVAAFLGIGGALLGRSFSLPLLYYLDPAAGLVVAVFIIKTGYSIAKEAAIDLMDTSMGEEMTRDISSSCLGVKGVEEIHQIRTRIAGAGVFVDLEIGVREDITVKAGHDVAHKVKQKLLQDNEEILDVLIHVNPCRQKD